MFAKRGEAQTNAWAVSALVGCVGLQISLPTRGVFLIYFSKSFLQKYIFNFIIYSFVPLPPGCGAAGCFNRILAPRGRPPPGGGAVGQAAGRQAPPPKLNLERQCGSAALDVVLDILDRNKNH